MSRRRHTHDGWSLRPRASPDIRARIELECEPLPGMVARFESSTVLSGDLPEQLQGTAVIHAGRILVEVFAQKLATHGADGVGFRESDVHLAASEEREAVQ